MVAEVHHGGKGLNVRRYLHFNGALFFLLQVLDRAEYLGSGLLQRGLEASPKSFIGIFAQNRPEVIFQLQHL